MAKNQRRSLFLLIIILILSIGCVGLVSGYLYVSSEVAAQFGKPSSLLTLTQQIGRAHV